jgi:hypothetical protein
MPSVEEASRAAVPKNQDPDGNEKTAMEPEQTQDISVFCIQFYQVFIP